MKKNKLNEYGCYDMNEAFCEESLNDDMLDINIAEKELFEENKEEW